jgi:hypothetical protein
MNLNSCIIILLTHLPVCCYICTPHITPVCFCQAGRGHCTTLPDEGTCPSLNLPLGTCWIRHSSTPDTLKRKNTTVRIITPDTLKRKNTTVRIITPDIMKRKNITIITSNTLKRKMQPLRLSHQTLWRGKCNNYHTGHYKEENATVKIITSDENYDYNYHTGFYEEEKI